MKSLEANQPAPPADVDPVDVPDVDDRLAGRPEVPVRGRRARSISRPRQGVAAALVPLVLAPVAVYRYAVRRFDRHTLA